MATIVFNGPDIHKTLDILDRLKGVKKCYCGKGIPHSQDMCFACSQEVMQEVAEE